jgi:hypothetical protein
MTLDAPKLTDALKISAICFLRESPWLFNYDNSQAVHGDCQCGGGGHCVGFLSCKLLTACLWRL